MKLFASIILVFGTLFHSISQSFIKTTKPGLYYIFKAPKIKSAKPPVIILMHGIGSNEKDLFSFADQFPDSFLVISLRAPITLSNDSYAWYQLSYLGEKPSADKIQAEKSRQLIVQFIDQLKTKHTFNDKRVYLFGFSQGSIMAYSVGLTIPDKIKGIAVMSGRLLENVKPIIAPKEKLKNLKIFISHGTNDGVITVKEARDANTYLKNLGLNPTYKEYPEAHHISNDMFSDMFLWLKK